MQAEDLGDACEDVIDRTCTVDAVVFAELLIEVGDGFCLLVIDLKPVTDGVFIVVGSAACLPACYETVDEFLLIHV